MNVLAHVSIELLSFADRLQGQERMIPSYAERAAFQDFLLQARVQTNGSILITMQGPYYLDGYVSTVRRRVVYNQASDLAL